MIRSIQHAALLLGQLLALGALLAWTPGAWAAATTCTSAGGSLTLPPVTLASNPPVGTLLGAPASVTVTFTCSGLPSEQPSPPQNYSATATIQAGLLAPADPTDNPNGSNGIMFATNLPGVALQVTASPVQANDRAWLRGGPGSTRGFEPGTVTAPLSAWQCIQPQHHWCAGWGGTYSGSVSETFTAQLIATGPITSGTVNSINLMQFNWYIYGIGPSEGYFASLILNAVTVSPPACTLLNPNQTVTLPTVNASGFTAQGSTAGLAPFTIQLSCNPGTNLAITLATGSPVAGMTGVIANTTGAGYAQNVGVQITDWNQNPVPFDTPVSQGVSPNGAFNLSFYARYYQTGSGGVSGGVVHAAATYTLTYQ